MLKRAVLLCEEVRCDEITNRAQVKTAEKSIAFGGVFPNITEAILVDEINTKVIT